MPEHAPEWPPDDARRTPITLRGEYIARGYTDRALATFVRAGTLAKPRRGAYVTGEAWRSLDVRGRHSVRARAVLAQAKTEVALSHVSGLLEFDAPVWGLALDDVHLTRMDRRTGRPEAGVRQHRGTVLPTDVVQRNGIPVMHPTRLGLELTTIADVEHSLVVVDDLLHRRLTTREALEDRYRLMTQWPHSLTTDLVLRLADSRIESAGEARGYYLCFSQGLPMPQLQYEVRDARGKLVARLDFAWPELGAFMEFDGRVKYEKLLRPGQRASDVVVAEKQREELVCRLTGWRCIRIDWADLDHPERTAARIRAVLMPHAA